MEELIDTNALDLTKISKDIKVSTMSATCSLGVDIDLQMIFKYLSLKKEDIVTVKYKGLVKSLDPIKKKKKNKKPKSFHNQLTVEIRPDIIKLPDNKISIKIFKNGSIQMSGVKSLNACNLALNKLVNFLKKDWVTIDNDNIKEICFVDNKDNLSINNFKVDMINSNFNINWEINRESLYNICLGDRIECRYEPSIHACVNIKFKPVSLDKKVSIFVFQSGNLIITGAKNIDNITESYNYITELLRKNKKMIQKSKISEILFDNMTDELKELLKVDEEDNLANIALETI